MRGLFLAVFALFIVAGDSGRYAPQLVLNARFSLAHVSSDNIGHVNSAFGMLWIASLQGSNDAQTTILDTLSYEKSDDGSHSMLSRDITIYWLEKLVQLDNADAAWLLYQLLGEDGASERFMRLAALGNVAQAQLAFAMSTDSPEKREKWLVRAAAQNYVLRRKPHLQIGICFTGSIRWQNHSLQLPRHSTCKAHSNTAGCCGMKVILTKRKFNCCAPPS